MMTVIAFLPDMVHAAPDAGDHHPADHSHDDDTQQFGDKNHCHSGVSCTGALGLRDWTLPAQNWVRMDILGVPYLNFPEGHALGRDPPVPIVRA